MNFSKAFTIIELIFVIVVLGILSAVALPKFADTRVQADIAKGRADIATIRSAIVNERQSRLILGDSSYIDKLSTSSAATTLFTGNGTNTLLTYGIKAGTADGDWSITNDTTYVYRAGGTPTTFTYTPASGTFTCASGTGRCDSLVD